MGGGIHSPFLYVRGLTSQDHYSRVDERGFGISVALYRWSNKRI